MSEYDGSQFVGIDLHRRRSVVVRTTAGGEALEWIPCRAPQPVGRARWLRGRVPNGLGAGWSEGVSRDGREEWTGGSVEPPLGQAELVGHLRDDVGDPVTGRDAIDVLSPAVCVGKVK